MTAEPFPRRALRALRLFAYAMAVDERFARARGGLRVRGKDIDAAIKAGLIVRRDAQRRTFLFATPDARDYLPRRAASNG